MLSKLITNIFIDGGRTRDPLVKIDLLSLNEMKQLFKHSLRENKSLINFVLSMLNWKGALCASAKPILDALISD